MNVQLVAVRAVGPFTFRWPDAVESFDHGWEGIARVGAREFRFKHGIGRRVAYGRPRVHSVTWLGGQPEVEGVEADDYERSQALITRIKRSDRKLARNLAEVPPGYEGFLIVNHRDEIDAPYSPNGLAVKIRDDDMEAWISAAVLRAGDPGGPGARVPEQPKDSDPGPSTSAPPHTAEAIPGNKQAVAEALLEYAASYEVPRGEPLPPLTPDKEADAFVRADPFAFLLAVIFDQGIPYERAWRAPLDLRGRLGQLDPVSIVSDPAAVGYAVQKAPALHRYVNNMPSWIVAAADRVVRDYQGDASRIWSDHPTAEKLQGRLLAFEGIGPKKAAMAVELLERHLGVPIRMMEGSDIAYDIHVRRVFLRTGLADRDDPGHMIAVARELHPARPGMLDDPAWRIGKLWCHAREPECSDCRIAHACPKLIDRAAGVMGA